MRHLVTVLVLSSVVLASCGAKEEEPAADAAAASVSAAALSAEELAGTWEGTSYAVPGDSVTATWTAMSSGDGNGKLLINGQTDSVSYTSMFDADSVMMTSATYTDATLPAGTPPFMFKGVGRRTSDGKLTGTTTIRLASNPDSVVTTVRWESTRKP